MSDDIPLKEPLMKDGKVFLSKFLDSEMEQDADNYYSRVNDYFRVKTYTKAEQRFLHSSLQDFSEPYRVVQHYLGGTWNDYNSPFIVQVGACNLNCPFCFVDRKLFSLTSKYGKQFSAQEVLDKYLEVMGPYGILRISGGEPFLAHKFIIDLIACLGKYYDTNEEDHKEIYLWLDTNLLGKGYGQVIYEAWLRQVNVGICGCFKGFTEEHFRKNVGVKEFSLQEQFDNAAEIIQAYNDYLDTKYNTVEIFFYVTEYTEEIEESLLKANVLNFITRLGEIHRNVPLRTTVLKLKEYSTNKNRFHKSPLALSTKAIFQSFLDVIYGTKLTWLPQHQHSLAIRPSTNQENKE